MPFGIGSTRQGLPKMGVKQEWFQVRDLIRYCHSKYLLSPYSLTVTDQAMESSPLVPVF